MIVLAGLGGALVSAAGRWQTEARNRSVEITLDYAEVRALAAGEGRPIKDVLARMKAAGVTSIALTEDTVASLDEGHRMDVMFVRDTNRVSLGLADTETARRVKEALKVKLRGGIRVNDSENFITVFAPYGVIRALGIGLDPKSVSEIREAGLALVGRVGNYNGVRPDGIAWTLDSLKKAGARTVIFSGDEVLGYRGYALDDPEQPGRLSTATALRNDDLNVGMVEFAKRKGDETLAKAAAPNVVRVHTVTDAEMVTTDIPSNVQRYLLAARERNFRLLYIRLFLKEPDPLETNATTYIEPIRDGLERGGLVPGLAHPYQPLTTPLYLRALIGLGLAAAYLLLLDSITRLFAGGAGGGVITLAYLGVLVLAALPAAPMLLGVKLAALAAACIYPSLAVLYNDPLLPPQTSRHPALYALVRFAAMCFITGLGIAAIVGLLADRLFLIKADAFLGIKGAQLVPLLLVAVVCGLGLRADIHRTFRKALGDFSNRLSDIAAHPILLYQVILGIAALVVMALLVLRSGNDPGVGVSPLELKVRAILDAVLYARPRFKEFLVGHPAMLLGLIYAAEGRRKWALPLLIVGTIGQVSLLNTFCHIHTPLLVSAWRAGLGIGIGIMIGLILYILIPGASRHPDRAD